MPHQTVKSRREPMRTACLAASIGLLSLHGMAAAGQTARPASASPPPVPPALSQPATPQRTTATFADWTLRCERTEGAPDVCEIVQVVSAGSQPVAQIAVGRSARNEPLRITILVPPNVSLPQPAHLEAPGKDGGKDGGKELADIVLDWRRCLPGGCLAGAALADDTVRALRARPDPTRITFTDGLGKPAALPFSPKGLAPALDALAKEEK